MDKRERLGELCVSAVFTVILAVSSWIALPFFGGVSLTLQTLAVALCGYFLGIGAGSAALSAYLLLGIAGVPVFSGFSAGAGVLFGPSGGFLYGFFALLALCALGGRCGRICAVLSGVAGVVLCHVCGVLHYCAVADVPLAAAAVSVSLPFILKDVISVAVAYTLSVILKKRSHLK